MRAPHTCHWVTHPTSSSGSALVSLPLVDSTLFECISQDPLVQRVPCLSCINSEGFCWKELQRSPGPIFVSFRQRDRFREGVTLGQGHTPGQEHNPGQSLGLLIHRPGFCSLPHSASEGTIYYSCSRCSGPIKGPIPVWWLVFKPDHMFRELACGSGGGKVERERQGN